MPEPRIEDFLPPAAALALRAEINDWQRRCPDRLKDEASLRYIFQAVLDRFGLECPHPFRTPISRTLSQEAFECRLCRAYVINHPESVATATRKKH